MTRYVALLDGVEGAYGIVFPDLPGCTAAGETIADAVTDAIEAVREWILDAREDGEAVPEPRDMAALKANGRVAEALRDGAAFIVIPVLINSGRPAKANLSLELGTARGHRRRRQGERTYTVELHRYSRSREDQRQRLRAAAILAPCGRAL